MSNSRPKTNTAIAAEEPVPDIDLAKEKKEIQTDPNAYYQDHKDVISNRTKQQLKHLAAIQHHIKMKNQFDFFIPGVDPVDPQERHETSMARSAGRNLPAKWLIKDVNYTKIKPHLRKEKIETAEREFAEMKLLETEMEIPGWRMRSKLEEICIAERGYHSWQIEEHIERFNQAQPANCKALDINSISVNEIENQIREILQADVEARIANIAAAAEAKRLAEVAEARKLDEAAKAKERAAERKAQIIIEAKEAGKRVEEARKNEDMKKGRERVYTLYVTDILEKNQIHTVQESEKEALVAIAIAQHEKYDQIKGPTQTQLDLLEFLILLNAKKLKPGLSKTDEAKIQECITITEKLIKRGDLSMSHLQENLKKTLFSPILSFSRNSPLKELKSSLVALVQEENERNERVNKKNISPTPLSKR